MSASIGNDFSIYSIGRCKATPVLCSCHFTETNEMPIPYFENRRKRQRERLQRDDDLQSKAKQRIQSNMDEFLDVDYLIEDDNEVVVIEDTKDTEEEQIILELVELDELTGDEILLLDEMSTIEDVDSPDEKAEYILGS